MCHSSGNKGLQQAGTSRATEEAQKCRAAQCPGSAEQSYSGLRAGGHLTGRRDIVHRPPEPGPMVNSKPEPEEDTVPLDATSKWHPVLQFLSLNGHTGLLHMQEAKDTLIVDGHLREAGNDLGSVCSPVCAQDIQR